MACRIARWSFKLPSSRPPLSAQCSLSHLYWNDSLDMNIGTTLSILCLAVCIHLLIMVGHLKPCGSPCTREFSDSAGLGRHRRACEHYKHRLDLQAQRFKRACGKDPKHSKARAFKRMKLSSASTSNTIQVSSWHNCNLWSTVIG